MGRKVEPGFSSRGVEKIVEYVQGGYNWYGLSEKLVRSYFECILGRKWEDDQRVLDRRHREFRVERIARIRESTLDLNE